MSYPIALRNAGSFTKVDTTFLWASGAPGGLLLGVWHVRLIPHYSLGVWFLISHMGLGLRGALLAHGVSPLAAGRVAWIANPIAEAIIETFSR